MLKRKHLFNASRFTKLLVKTLTGTFGLLLFISLLLTHYSKPVNAANIFWDGGAATQNWSDAQNWSSNTVPGPDDDILIDTTTTVNLNSQTTVNSLTLGNNLGSTSPILNFSYDAISNGALILDGGDLIVYSNAVITHSPASEDNVVGMVNIDIQTGSATITGTINANGKGYPGGSTNLHVNGYGPSGGIGTTCSTTSRGGAAGHGGKSQWTVGFTAVDVYGNAFEPNLLGSGGAGGFEWGGCQPGGNGGGAIKLVANGNIQVNGSITSNGIDGNIGGGGAGGSIWLKAANLSGSGSIISNGGTGGGYAVGAGGGRVLLEYGTANTFSGTLTATVGSGGSGGENGTVVIKDYTNNDIIINNTQRWTANPANEGSSQTFRNFTIQNNSTLTLKGYHTNDTDGVGFDFDVANLTVESGSKLSSDGGGYAGGTTAAHVNGYGPGAGIGISCDGPTSTRGGSASYGGKGKTHSSSAIADIYGSAFTPTQLGSGGAGGFEWWGCQPGGDGGGAINVTATSEINIAGTLSANGINGMIGGGGSGGSIWLKTPTFTGTGIVSANGGTGGDYSAGAGGGRILIEYGLSNNFAGTLSATVGAGGTGGENGTVLIKDFTNNDIYVRNTQIWNANPANEGSLHTFRNFNIQNNATLNLIGYYTNETDGIGFTFNLDNLTVDTGSTLASNGGGYAGGLSGHLNGYGSGGGTGLCNTNGDYTAGGGYGGIGQTVAGRAGGGTYGSQEEPTDLGSGGGAGMEWSTCWQGGNGGGAIKLNTGNSVTVNGTLSSNGLMSPSGASGAGSGGSLWINTGILEGSGNITAFGGNGAWPGGGDGGGGRIAVYYSTNNWAGNLLDPNNPTASSKGTYSTGATNGTVYLSQHYKITDVPTDVNARDSSNNSIDYTTYYTTGTKTVRAWKDIDGTEYLVFDADVLFDQNRDWGSLTIDSDPILNKAITIFDNSNHGHNGVYTLYVVKGITDRLRVCPNATSITEVTRECANAVLFMGTFPQTAGVGDDTVTISEETINSIAYWKVEGYTGSGAMGDVAEEPVIPNPQPVPVDTPEEQPTTNPDQNQTPSPVNNNQRGSYANIPYANPEISEAEEPTLDPNKQNLTTRVQRDFTSIGENETQSASSAPDNEITNSENFITSLTKNFSEEELTTVASTAVVVSAGVSLTMLGVNLLELPYIVLNGGVNLLGSLLFYRKRKPYGYVYNAHTKEPISQAIVRIYDVSGKLVATSVTDTYGAFTAALSRGRYKITVHKPKFTFPSSMVQESVDYPLQNVYHDEVLNVSENKEVMSAIPIDPENTDQKVSLIRRVWNKNFNLLKIINISLFVFGLGFSIASAVRNPNTFNYIVLLVYLPSFFLIVKMWTSQNGTYGKVANRIGQTLDGIIIGLRELDFGRIVSTRVTNSEGEYRFLTHGGNYKLEVLNDGLNVTTPEQELVVKSPAKENIVIAKDIAVESSQ